MNSRRIQVVVGTSAALFLSVLCMCTAAWADGEETSSGMLTFFAGHFRLLCLLWLVAVVVSLVISHFLKEALFEGNLGTRLLFCFLTVLNGIFLLSPAYIMDDAAWWYNILQGFMMVGLILLSFPVLGNFLFKSFEEETGRESKKWFSTTVRYNVYSGSEAIRKGHENWTGIQLFSLLLCLMSFTAHLLLDHRAASEDKKMTSLLAEARVLLDQQKDILDRGLLIVDKERKIYSLHDAEIPNLHGRQSLIRECLSENRPRSGDAIDRYVYFKATNYAVFVPLQSMASMANTNQQFALNKRLKYDIFEISYMVKGNAKTILGCSMGSPPQSISGRVPSGTDSGKAFVDINDIVMLENMTPDANYYDPLAQPIKTPLYHAEIRFHDGETIRFSSPLLGGTWQGGNLRALKLYSDTESFFVPFDEIAAIRFEPLAEESSLKLRVTRTTGEVIEGFKNVSERNWEEFTGISSAGWIVLDMEAVSSIEFDRHSDGSA